MVDNNESATNWLERLAESLGIDALEVALRKAYLGFDARDEAVLARLHDTLPGVRSQVIDEFYEHILKFAPTRALLAGEGAHERLKRTQSNYFDALIAGEYGSDYVQDRLRVGVAHQRIGLEPKWYIGAYCKYLTSLLSGIETLPGIDPRDIPQVRDALLKLLFFDMGLALDTYIHAEHQAMLEQRDYAESIVCSVPIGLLALSTDLRVYSVNSAIDEIFGVRHCDMAGLPLDDVIPVMGLRERAQDVLATGIPQYGVMASLDSGRNLQIAITPIRYSGSDHDASKSKARLLLLIEDMTETTQLRESTLESDARARAIMDNVIDGIVTTDEQGLVESFNNAAERIFGYSAVEVLGRNVKLLMPEPYHGEHDGYLQRYLHTGESHCMGIGMREVMGRRKDGSEFPMDLATNELRIGSRRLFVGVVRDITERRRGMLELLKLSSAIDQTADGVVITDRDGVIEYVNPAFERTTGYSRAEAVGRKPNLLKSGQHSDAFYKHLWCIILNGEPFRGIFINRSKHGDIYYEEKTITPLRDAQGVITHFVSTGRDVTERKRAEEKLQKLNDTLEARVSERTAALAEAKEEAENANRTKSDFLSRMSHELRTPLNAIIGFAQLIEMDALASEEENTIQNVRDVLNSGQHLLALVNDLLDFAKLEVGKLKIEPSQTNLLLTAIDSIGAVRTLAKTRNIEIRLVNRLLENHGEIWADPLRTKQVLLNLLSNAIKYNKEGGSIEVALETLNSEFVRLSVKDSGIGIPEESINELFLPFSRLHASNTYVEGAGIGLSITKDLVEMMGGRIGVKSVSGEGTTFWIDLPTYTENTGAH